MNYEEVEWPVVGAETKIPYYRATIDKWFWMKDGVTHNFWYGYDQYMEVQWIWTIWQAVKILVYFISSIGFSLLLSVAAENSDFLEQTPVPK